MTRLHAHSVTVQRRRFGVSLAGLLLAASPAWSQNAAAAGPPPTILGAFNQALSEVIQIIVKYLPSLVMALLVLIIGLILAKLLSTGVARLVKATKLDERCERYGLKGLGRFSTALGTGIYCLIMLFVLIVFLEVLKIRLITAPITEMVTDILTYIPRLLGALFLMLCAWIIAIVLRGLTIKLLQGRRLDTVYQEKMAAPATGAEGVAQARPKPSETIGSIVYGLVIVFALPMFFEALNLTEIVQPLKEMLGKFLNMVPNIFAAVVIMVLGFVLAKFVRDLVTSLVSATKLEELGKKAGIGNLATLVGTVVYALILIPIVIMALQTLKLSVITAPSELMLTRLLEAIPRIFAAVLILSISFVLAKFVGSIVAAFLAGLGLDGLVTKLKLLPADRPETAKKPSDICGMLAVAFIMVAAIMEASDFLGLTLVSRLLGDLIPFASRLLFGLLVLAIGLALANALQRLINDMVGNGRHWLGVVAKIAVIYVSIGYALNAIGMAERIVSLAFGLPLTALAIAMAIGFGIAFGAGGRKLAEQKLQKWFGDTAQP